MNCRKGDIAIIRRPGTSDCNVDRMVHVDSPSHLYGPGWWFVESIGSPIIATAENGQTVERRFAHIEDSRLRPIRGGEGPDETLAWKPVGEGVEA